jgi:hypothetical protein
LYTLNLAERFGVQERTVIAENLPKDHTIESLTALFNAVGTVKTLRVCDAAEAQTSKQVRRVAPRGELNGELPKGQLLAQHPLHEHACA